MHALHFNEKDFYVNTIEEFHIHQNAINVIM